MPSHKKHPVFLRIIAHKNSVVCINPLQLASFQIMEKAKLTDKDGKVTEADTIRLFYPSGTGMSYSVGKDITQEEFAYICETLREYLYLNEQEFKAKTAALEAQRIAEWNDKMAAPEVDAVESAEPTVA